MVLHTKRAGRAEGDDIYVLELKTVYYMFPINAYLTRLVGCCTEQRQKKKIRIV